MVTVVSFDAAFDWLSQLKTNQGKSAKQHLLLDNGFSSAVDVARFSYTALRKEAESQRLIGPLAPHFFESLAPRTSSG